MQKIVIVGGGVGGLQSALNLEKTFSRQEVEITLIDKRDYHLFTPNLYEVAASEEELTSASQIRKSITLPFAEVLKGRKIKFIQGEVKEIKTEEKKVVLASKQLSYDYLILALGSESDFFGIKGAKENSLVLKSLPDALRIRNAMEFMVSSRTQDMNKSVLRVAVAGGGYTGLELAAELKGLMDILSLKYQYPREKIEIQVIEANNKLVAGLDDRLSIDAYNRLLDIGVKVSIAARISEVDHHYVYLMSGEKIAYDCLVWTTGIKAMPIECNLTLNLDGKGKVCVNEFLQSQRHHEIFALGDMACVFGPQNRPVPPTAQDAWHEARYVAYALPYIMKNKKPSRAYVPKKHGFIVALGGKWAIMSYNGVYLKGFLAWAADQAAHIRYYASIVGWVRALRYVMLQVKVYSRNDM